MPDPLVDVRSAGRTFGAGPMAVHALASATCRIFPGDRIAIVGPSGCGKSTLLHLIADLDEPTSGSVLWPGLGTHGTLRPARIAVVFQAQSLLPALTVIENVTLPLLLQDQAQSAEAKAREALARLGLDGLAGKLPETLSGGQAQRVALARALCGRPRLLIADEPTGQLDHATAMELMRQLLGALDPTTALVVATHDPDVAGELSSIWHMERGVLQTGTATEVAA